MLDTIIRELPRTHPSVASIAIPRVTLDRLVEAAKKRRMRPQILAVKLLEAIGRDGLVDAVLDDRKGQ